MKVKKILIALTVQMVIVSVAFVAGHQHSKLTSWHPINDGVWEKWLVSTDGFIRLSAGYLDGTVWQVATQLDWRRNVTSLQYCRSEDGTPELVECQHDEGSPLRHGWDWLFADAPFPLLTEDLSGDSEEHEESTLI